MSILTSPTQLVLGRLENDFVSFGICVVLLFLYHIFLRYRLKKNPTYTVQAVNALARAAWVKSIMEKDDQGILAVQTLRNATMTATFLASTASLLIIGVLTLSAQGSNLSNTWHVLNTFGSVRPDVWLTKLILLLLNLFVAFFSFLMSIRLFNHVGFMINVPVGKNHEPVSPTHVAYHLNRAGSFLSIGMRSYYFAVPLVFWLFGPHFMLLSSVVLIVVLYRIDKAPHVANDFGRLANPINLVRRTSKVVRK